eukprot:258399-Amphidinium_carterae.1
MHTGASTLVAAPHHFSHKQLQHLRAEDPQSPTSMNGESLQIYGIRRVTVKHNNLAIAATTLQM